MLNLVGDHLSSNGELPADVKNRLEKEYLPRYLRERRWFARKGDVPPLLTIRQAISLEVAGGPVLLFVEEGVQKPQTYFLPVGIVRGEEASKFEGIQICRAHLASGKGLLVDALEDSRLFLELLRALEHLQTNGQLERLGLKLALTSRLSTKVTDRDIRRLGAEQSNSSLRVGSTLFKAFRKLESGVHPELELGRYLSDQAHFANTPQFLGSLEKMESEPVTLCMFQQLIENKGNAWEVVCDLVHARMDDYSSKLLSLAALLGSRTAKMHTALSSGADHEFTAEPIHSQDISAWIHDVCDHATRSVDALIDHPSPVCQRLVARREELYSVIRSLSPRNVHSFKCRLHGDFHLGQILVTDDDVFIIDFEGEPMRTFSERRSKYPPMKDIAGLLRSLDYAAAAAAKSAQRATPEVADALADAKQVFLQSYQAEARGFPEDIHEANALLRLFLFEKTFYEIQYEIHNRPGWVDIPVAGALALLDGQITLFLEKRNISISSQQPVKS